MNRILTLILLFNTGIILAQPNFVSGSITKLNGEVIPGKIDYRAWNITPRQIRFQAADAPSQIKTYSSHDIAGFKIEHNQEEYRRAVVGINREPVEGPKLKTFESAEELDQVLKLDIDTVFLLTLVKGWVNLYTLNDGNKVHYFIQKHQGRIEALIHRVVLVKDALLHSMAGIQGVQQAAVPGSAYTKVQFDHYKRQLWDVMRECPLVETPISKVTYSNQIVDLVIQYNECVVALDYVKTKDRAQHALYGFVGMSQPFFAFKNGDLQNFQNLSPTATLVFGLGFDVGLIRSLDKLSLGLEANYVKADAETNTTTVVAGSGEIRLNNQYNFDIQGFRLN